MADQVESKPASTGAPKPGYEKSGFWADLQKDFPSSIAVALVALPLCLGIAVASDAPPISGIISGIVGGLVVGLISRSSTSVAGPAAGLTAVVLAAIASFDGHFETFLIAVVLAGVLQIGLGIARAGFIANYFPSSVISGLLAAIGLILIIKQIPHAFGIDKDPEGDFSYVQPDQENTFSELLQIGTQINWGAVVISVVCLLLILGWDRSPLKKLPVPASLLAVAVGIAINLGFQRFAPAYALSGNHLVELPKFDGIADVGQLLTFPDWSKLFSEDFGHIIFVAFELAVIASLETLLNVEAVDKLDPKKRHSPPNRELFAQGIGNVTAGLIGGLPVTSVIVRSSVNVNSGNATKKSTILHGALLAISVATIPFVLNMIPLASLAAILLVTGYKLASFALFRNYYRRGWTQFLPFVATIVAILFTDLLIGITIGLCIGIFFVLKNNMQRPLTFEEEQLAAGSVIRLKFSQQVTFLNRASILTTLENLPKGAQIIVDATESDYIDEDVLQLIREFRDEEAPVKNIQMNLVGFRESYALENSVDYINVLTAETQSKMNPQDVLKILKEGNERFVNGKRTSRDMLRQISLTSQTQHPMAAVLSCIDSRTTSELIFDLGLGDIFSVRVAGNVINEDVLASLEYSTKVAGAKLIVVKGHTNCGAIKAACDSVELGNVTALLRKIQTAIESEHSTQRDRSSNNERFVSNVTRLNVLASIAQILERSETIAELVDEGQVAIVGAIYDTATGKVDFYGNMPETIPQESLATT